MFCFIWNIEDLLKILEFDSIWVSTDDILIAKEAERCKALVHWRASYTATDSAATVTAVKEFLKKHEGIIFYSIAMLYYVSQLVFSISIKKKTRLKYSCNIYRKNLFPRLFSEFGSC